MILSMTGYGAAHASEAGVYYSVELRSLNNRYYKASIKLPEGLQCLEPEVDSWLRGSLGRGSITYVLRVRDESASAAYHVNAAALGAYVATLRALRGGADDTSIDLTGLLLLPGVCELPECDEATIAARRQVVERLTHQAVAELMAMRRAEGAALCAHLFAQCDGIAARLDDVARRAPHVVEEYCDKLRQRASRLLQQAQLELNQETLLREVAVFADRCDISEEIARLRSHLSQFRELCNGSDEAGRRLEFLTQEMHREANTISSKSNDTDIARLIVEVKAGIERLKEQVQNVE